MPAPSLVILDSLGATITQGTAQVVTGQVPGVPTAAVSYAVKNDGAGNDTAFNVKAVVTGRLSSAGGDYLSSGVQYVDEGALEVRLLDALGGSPTSAWIPGGYQLTITLGDLAGDASQAFEARISGQTDTPQVELLLTVLRDLRASPVGDDIGTGSGVHLGAGDGSTTDLFSRSGAATAVGTPSHIVEMDDQAWAYRGEFYQLLAADLHTTNEDGSDVAISPADATQGYYIGLTLGDVVVLADTWTVSAASPNVTAVNTAGDATTALTVGDYVHLGGEIHEVLTITDDDNIVLHTNHAAGATAQPMFKGFTVTKGDQVDLGSRSDADKPALPVGEVFASATGPEGQIWIWREGDATVEQGDIDDTGTSGFYSRTVSGLDVTVARGRSKVKGYEADTSTSDTITLATNQTSLIQINGPDDASIEAAVDDTLNPGCMALHADTTDGAGVTATQDRRKYLGGIPVSAFFPDMTTADVPAGARVVVAVANPLNCPVYVRPGSFRAELDVADPSSLGWASGSWIWNAYVLEAGVESSIFRSSGTDDRRPQIAEAATSGVDTTAKHEQCRLEPGQSLVVALAAIPATPGTDPQYGIVSWEWSPAR